MSEFIEDNRNELKSELNSKLEKVVVSFLNNKDGGNIFIGVNDDGTVLGVKDIDKIQLEIKDRIKNNILPSTLGLFDVIVKELDSKKVINIVIASGSEKPYYIRKYGMTEKGCFMRVGSSTEEMPQDIINNMFSKRTRNSLKQIDSPRQDLTFSQLKIYYEEKGYEIGDNFLQQLELIKEGGKYNYVAYLLADNNTISIKVAKYKGTDTYDLIENQEYGFCSLIKATKNVLNKFDIENRTFTKITYPNRKEIQMVDKVALREAVVNAIVHNDYSNEYPPKFEIFDDHIEISSTGGLPEMYTKEDFFEGFSAPKNKELMRVFKDLELVEHLGTGIRRILKVYDRDIYQFSPNFIRVTFKYNKNAFLENESGVKNGAKNGAKNENAVIEAIMGNEEVTIKELTDITNIAQRTIQRILKKLQDRGTLVREGSRTKGKWIIKK